MKDGIPLGDKAHARNEGLRYSLSIPHGVEPGRYTIRIDDVDGKESSCQVSVEGIELSWVLFDDIFTLSEETGNISVQRMFSNFIQHNLINLLKSYLNVSEINKEENLLK